MAARRAWRREDRATYDALDLRAHGLLRDVPLHDVWSVDLPGSDADTTVLDVREFAGSEAARNANPVVTALFALRAGLGRLFRWDREGARPPATESRLARLTPRMREHSLVEPGTRDGPFTVIYVDRHESISEALNRAVHAFLVFALTPADGGHRLIWAVHVVRGSALTRAYMALIDPFRRFIVYPAILRQIHRGWCSSRRADNGRIDD